jgi:hypothetical protein
MRTKAIAIIVAGFVISFACCFIAIAANDTPHNASNNISCGSCHGEGILNSPFWGGSYTPATPDDTIYNNLCRSCHTEQSPGEGGYPETKGPLVKTHSDYSITGGDSWKRECRDCHNPHYQRQKVYKNTDASNLYLAKGKITSCEYTCPVCPQVIGTTTFTFSTITYKSGWEWNPPTNTKLAAKTGDYRGAILFPNIGKLGYNYPITAVGATTITVKGNAAAFFCPSQTYTCDPPFDPSNQFCCEHPDDPSCLNLQTYPCNLPSPTDFAVIYGQYIKDVIDISPDGSGNNKTVKSLDQVGPKSFADGDITYDGVCEVCHTLTKYHRNDSSGDHTHYVADNCSRCHSHTGGFAHGGGGGTGCDSCHGHDNGWQGGEYSGTTVSHSTHTENEPDDYKVVPAKNCGDCHDTNNYPNFIFVEENDSNGDGKIDLSETDVCDTCHSPGGSFNGVQTVPPSIGAKDNWKTGVYQTDSTLSPGKEKWCAGCHDNAPASGTAPDIVGDNTTYGYYLVAHGNATDGVKRLANYSKGECVHCHDVSKEKMTYPVPPSPIINESFERNPGYDETWTESNPPYPNEDSALPAPLTGAGSQCLESISTSSLYQAYAKRDLGAEQPKTFTTFYLYVGVELLSNTNYKVIGSLQDGSPTPKDVFIFRLNKNSGQLRFNLQIYNNGVWTDYFYNICISTWYKIDVKYDNNNNTWEWRVNGETQPDPTFNNTLTGTHRTGIRIWTFGFKRPASDTLRGTIYFDKIAVDTNNWVGEVQGTEYIYHGGQLFYTPLIADQVTGLTGFCFKCHTDYSESLQTSMPSQYSYSYLHGGSTNECPDDIRQALAAEYIHDFSNSNDWTLSGSASISGGVLHCPPPDYGDNNNPRLQTGGKFILKVKAIDSNPAQTEGPEIREFNQGDSNSTGFDISGSTIRILYGASPQVTSCITRQATIYLRVKRICDQAGVPLAGGCTYYFQAFKDASYSNPLSSEISWQNKSTLQVIIDKIQLLSGGTAEVDYDDFYFYPSPTCDPPGWGSSHWLTDVRDSLKGKWGWGDLVEYIEPCSGCHNPHRATQDYPASLADGHANPSTWEVWGDESGEKMADYVSGLGLIYQPPYTAGGGYERGANTQPDYNTLCLKCHSTGQTSTLHGIVNAVNWATSKHGQGAAGGTGLDWGILKPPYDEVYRGKYVLCCTDCHEPHGSTNSFLLRTTVNGVSGLTASDGSSWQGGKWLNWCSACHNITTPHYVERCGDSEGCHLGYSGAGKDHSNRF